MNKKVIAVFSLVTVLATNLLGQNTTEGVSISETPTPPSKNAMLDVQTADKGVLFPRVAKSTLVDGVLKPDNIVDGEDGLIVFVTDTGSDYGYWFFDRNESEWKKFASSASELWLNTENASSIYRNSSVGVYKNNPTFAFEVGGDYGENKFAEFNVFKFNTRAGSISYKGYSKTFPVSGEPLRYLWSNNLVMESIHGQTNGILMKHSESNHGLTIKTMSTGVEINNPLIHSEFTQASIHSTRNLHVSGSPLILSSYDVPNDTYGVLSIYASRTIFSGDVFINGSTPITSDSTLKTSISNLNNTYSIAQSKAKFKQLTPYSYYYKSQLNQRDKSNLTKHYGYMAQDVQLLFPEAVVKTTMRTPIQSDTNGEIEDGQMEYEEKEVLALDYHKISIISFEIIKDLLNENETQQAEINELKALINALASRVESLENN